MENIIDYKFQQIEQNIKNLSQNENKTQNSYPEVSNYIIHLTLNAKDT